MGGPRLKLKIRAIGSFGLHSSCQTVSRGQNTRVSSQPHHRENPDRTKGGKKNTSTRTKQGTRCSRPFVENRVGYDAPGHKDWDPREACLL